MVIAGVILLVGAVVAFVIAIPAFRRRRAMAQAETLSCAELTMLRGTATELGGTGFNRVCEVTGVAQVGPDGPQTAEMSQQQCVWHRHAVIRRYRETRRDSQGRTSTDQREETVSDFSSAVPFAVQDASGVIPVRPEGARMDGAELVVDRFERADDSGAEFQLGSFQLRLPGANGTIGYRYQEWIVRPGARLFVLGEVSDRTGELAMARPSQGQYLISTRSEQELTASARRTHVIASVAGAVAGVAGLVLLVAGLIS